MNNDTSAMHRQAWDLIPWIINGSVAERERLAVQAHMQSCADCREELEFQRRLLEAMAAQVPADTDPRDTWERLQSRIDAEPRKDPAGSRVLPSGDKLARRAQRVHRGWIPWLAAAMVVQAVGLGVLGTLLWSHSSPASPSATATLSAGAYRTLSAMPTAAPEASIRVVFAPEMTLGRLHGLLAQAGLRVVSGPSEAGVWSLAPAQESRQGASEAALRELRADAQVRFAEAVGSAP